MTFNIGFIYFLAALFVVMGGLAMFANARARHMY